MLKVVGGVYMRVGAAGLGQTMCGGNGNPTALSPWGDIGGRPRREGGGGCVHDAGVVEDHRGWTEFEGDPGKTEAWRVS